MEEVSHLWDHTMSWARRARVRMIRSGRPLFGREKGCESGYGGSLSRSTEKGMTVLSKQPCLMSLRKEVRQEEYSCRR